MKQKNDLARVILLPDGSVHIAFQDGHSISATPENLLELFSDPLDFIYIKSKTYKSTTQETNEKRVPLFEVLGLTLASISSDKQVVCDFPELFHYIATYNNNAEESRKLPLNMRAIENQHVLADEKSFLLQHYLEFTNRPVPAPQIQTCLSLREEAQAEIIRETLNIFLSHSFVEIPVNADVSTQIIAAANRVEQTDGPREKENYVGVTEYAQKYGCSKMTVYNYINEHKIEDFFQLKNKQYRININKPPIGHNAKHSTSKARNTPRKYMPKQTESAEDVAKYIIKEKIYSPKTAPFIHTFAELSYYIKHGYCEVFWNNRPALIIDINPEYVSSSSQDKRTNRQRILDGESPVPPYKHKDDKPYEIHHIGQHENSPFAIVPPYDHNGEGMKVSELARLGEPYYSNKTKGTGLGLMVTFRIVEAMNGTIEFNSCKGEGTEVLIKLPASSMK